MAARTLRAAALALTVVATVGCAGPAGDGQPAPARANPASEHCVEQGGRIEIREDHDGGQQGICVLPGGAECDEWAFFRGECGS